MRYVNDKYREFYKKQDRKKEYIDNRDYSWLVISLLFIVPLMLLILIGTAISISNKNEIERNKDRLIEISRNSFGCVQYRYNSDVLWKCPKNSEITQVEKQYCSSSPSNRSCVVVKEPVI